MIKSFADKKTKEIFAGRPVKNIHPDLQTKTLRRLPYINAAESLDDLRVPPSNKLEKKVGDLRDFYAIWVTSQYRGIFKWQDGDAYDVHMLDYHSFGEKA